jgi:predicted DNA-binding transcriptional regulator AlpA
LEYQKNIERYLSTNELMDALSISRSTVYRLLARGMPNIMVGSVHGFPVNQVVACLENQRENSSITV